MTKPTTKPPQGGTSAAQRPQPTERGRVIVKGKVPWDGEYERVPLHSARPKGPDDDGTKRRNHHSEAIKRKELAGMAKRTNETLRKSKHPGAAFFLSLCWAGLGNTYCGQVGIGAVMMLVGGICWILVAFGEYDMAWAAVLLGFLSAALARQQALRHNQANSAKAAAASRQRREAKLDMEKSIRLARHDGGPAER